MRLLVIVASIALHACTQPEPLVIVQPKPSQYAWWLRVKFNPSGKELRGLPVSEIDPSWCKINEIEARHFPNSEEVQSSNSGLRSRDATFAVENLVLSGKQAIAVLAVYARCDGQTGTAVIVLARSAQGPLSTLATVPLDTPAKWATIQRETDRQVKIWWCFECDDSTSLQWDDKTKSFQALPSEFE
jgi:hypothetical protein